MYDYHIVNKKLQIVWKKYPKTKSSINYIVSIINQSNL